MREVLLYLYWIARNKHASLAECGTLSTMGVVCGVGHVCSEGHFAGLGNSVSGVTGVVLSMLQWVSQ